MLLPVLRPSEGGGGDDRQRALVPSLLVTKKEDGKLENQVRILLSLYSMYTDTEQDFLGNLTSTWRV